MRDDRPQRPEKVEIKAMREIPHAVQALDEQISIQRELMQLLADRLVPALRKRQEPEAAKSPSEPYYESSLAAHIQELYVRVKNNNADLQLTLNLLEL